MADDTTANKTLEHSLKELNRLVSNFNLLIERASEVDGLELVRLELPVFMMTREIEKAVYGVNYDFQVWSECYSKDKPIEELLKPEGLPDVFEIFEKYRGMK